MTPASLGRVLTLAAERYSDAEAVVDGKRRATYRAFDGRVNRVAHALLRLGLRKGDHVVLLLKNREEHVVVYWACQKIGAIATPLNWRSSEGEVRYCVDDADGAAVVYGDIFTVGRVDDMIISGGENIYPIEVEEVLLRHPSVADVGVAGLPDPRWGQVVTAFVVVRRGPDGAPLPLAVEELDAFCQAAKDFAGFKRPRRYELVEALPRSPTGKLLRRKLLEAR